MSYEVLARRWRPPTFDDVCGQKHVTESLRNAIRGGRLPHAILLAGPRGVGKTSIARILARSLNCDEGPTDKPCGRCSPCTEIAAGRSLDVQEIDAASHTGVDNVRDIRDSIRYAAAPGKHRIFIIDEVHMLSTPAFNALLKTLEEPPPRSLFVFATTDPQKIPDTVLSRVTRFDLKRLASGESLERLRRIVAEEKIDAPEAVLRALIREADGSLRDALTLLDRLVSALGPKISEEDAAGVLDLVERRVVRAITAPILAGDAAGALDAVRAAFAQGIEPARLGGELLGELRDLVVCRLVDDPSELVEAPAEEVAALRERARAHDPEALQRLFRVLVTRLQELAWSPRPEHTLEMAVVRLATLPGTEALEGLIARLDALEKREPPAPAGGPPSPRGAGGGPGPRRAPGEGRGPETRPPRAEAAGERQLRARREAKSHPAVQQVIDALDAELKDVRLSEGGS